MAQGNFEQPDLTCIVKGKPVARKHHEAQVEVQNSGLLNEPISVIEMNEQETVTCQICARPIKASKGIIAHHGYRRPNRGSGWQTPSCAGARHLPYEKSCDMLPPTIEYIKNYILAQQNKLKEIQANPPEKLTIQMGLYSKPVEVVRPEEFDPNKESFKSYLIYSYESEFRRIVSDIKQSIKYAKIDQQFMEDRLAKWIPPNK